MCAYISCLWLEIIIMAASRQQYQWVVYFQIKIFRLLTAFKWTVCWNLYALWCMQGAIPIAMILKFPPSKTLLLGKRVTYHFVLTNQYDWWSISCNQHYSFYPHMLYFLFLNFVSFQLSTGSGPEEVKISRKKQWLSSKNNLQEIKKLLTKEKVLKK